MKLSRKPLGGNLLLIVQWKKWTTKFKRGRESIEADGRSSRPKDATADENVKVVHTLVLCDRRLDLQSIACEKGKSLGAVQSILTDILGMPTVLGAANVDWWSEKDSALKMITAIL